MEPSEMTKNTRLQQLGRSELEALAKKALTNQERNRQASAKVRQAKKAAGLQQISIWIPQGSPGIEKIKKYADDLCEKYLASRDAQANPPANPAREQGV